MPIQLFPLDEEQLPAELGDRVADGAFIHRPTGRSAPAYHRSQCSPQPRAYRACSCLGRYATSGRARHSVLLDTVLKVPGQALRRMALSAVGSYVYGPH